MRKLILCFAIASCIAAPIASAQGRSGGGGPPSGATGGNLGGGAQMGAPMGGPSMGGSINARGNADMNIGRDASLRSQQRLDAQARRQSPEQAMLGLSTAERARLLKDADLETRQAFGAYQAALAKANRDGDTDTVEPSAAAVSLAELDAFAADTQARAREQKGATREARKAFGAFQSALAREQALLRAADPASANAAFGMETASHAALQRDADAETRQAFGSEQSARAKAKSGDTDDGDIGDDD